MATAMLPSMAAQDSDPRNLHDLAVDCQTDVQKLATGLAHAGANPQAVSQLTKMASIIGQVVKALGAGPVGTQAQGPTQQAGPPQAGSPQAAAPPQGGPPQQGAPPPQQAQQHSLHAAAHSLHAAMVQSAQARQQR